MISVIIPLYNKEKIIERTLRSVLSQKYKDFEVVIVDDGSTDGSLAVVQTKYPKIMQEFNVDIPVIIIHQENGGPSKARNTGAKSANGDWLVFLDADDELLDGALSLFHNITDEHPDIDIVDCNKFLRIKNDLILQKHPFHGYVRNVYKEWYFGNISPGCGHSMFKKTFFLKFFYDERIRRYEDAEMLDRMLNGCCLFSIIQPTEIHDVNFIEASKPRSNIDEDYLGYINLSNKGFWRKMCIYKQFIEERENYKLECTHRYPFLYKRYDLLVLYKLLEIIKKIY